MKCRYCDTEIERAPLDDHYVSEFDGDYRWSNSVTEAWVGAGSLACKWRGLFPLCWHEPLIDIEEILASLKAIEADLR